MAKWILAAVLLVPLLVACGGNTGASSAPTFSQPPTSSASPTATVTGAPPTSVVLPGYGECIPNGPGTLPVASAPPGESPAPVATGLQPCGADEWRSALEPVVKAVNKDDKNFCSIFNATPELGFSGPWRMIINVIGDAEADARARIVTVIPDGAPVEWREVKYSCAQLNRITKGPLLKALGPDAFLSVNSYGVDVIANAVFVETRGPQPDLKAELQQKFGDKVVVREGPSASPEPI